MKTRSLLAALAISTLLSGAALAYDNDDRGCRGEYGHKNERMKHGGFHGRPNIKAIMDKEFSAEQIRTLAEARLLMKGNDNLTIGNINPTESGYTIEILTVDGSLVDSIEVAKNGIPMEHYQRMLKRKAKWEEQDS